MYFGIYPSNYHGTLSVLVPPAVEPVSLADLKAHLRVDIAADDTLITSLGIGARDYIERVTRRTMIFTGYQLLLDTYPGWELRLPRQPVAAQAAGTIFSFATPQNQYYDLNGTLQTLVAGTAYEYDLTHNPPRFVLPPMTYWPWTMLGKTNAVQIQFVAGYGNTAAAVPEMLKTAIKMLTAHWYQNREAVGNVGAEVPLAVDSICRIYGAGDYV